MINTKLTSQVISANKSDIKLDNSVNKDKLSQKDSPKEVLSQALKQSLGLSKNASSEEIISKFLQNETSSKLKELVNKLLEQINSQKNPNSPILKDGKNLNLAPNFANELKTLGVEMSKNDIFTQVLDKLNQILKPANEAKNNNIENLLKNSGVFLEAKLKDALNEEQLPKSFHSLLSSVKSLSNEKLGLEISKLANLNLSPKEALNELKNIITQSKNESKEILKQSEYKTLLNLSSKLENFKNYISKNPSKAQEKINELSSKISQELNKLKSSFLKELNKPENLLIKDTNILKQSASSFEKLENLIKNILNSKENPKENLAEKVLKNDKNEVIKENIKENSSLKNDIKKEEVKPDENSKNSELKNENLKQDIKENLKENQKEAKSEVGQEKNIKNEQKENKELKTENKNQNIQESRADKIENKAELKTQPNLSQNETNKSQILSQNLFKEENLKQNLLKNLAFSVENLDLEQVQELSKGINNLARKLNETLKNLEPNTQNALTNQNELKALEHKLGVSIKDLAQIKPKSEQDIAFSLNNDVKSTLLQISNLAQNEGNEAVYNQANRLLAQIELNQLMSLANDSINTYLPFSWDDLNDSKLIFRRGKKNKFFAQIKLEFAKLGDLEILISLNNEKYIDINIMAENVNFRKTIYENAHELKRNINKAGLLSANFFVGDIIRSKFDLRNMKNLDLEMGMDKKV